MDITLNLFQHFYELEYKFHQIRNSPFSGLEERRNNILRIIERKAKNIISIIAESLIKVFKDWLADHDINSGKAISGATDWWDYGLKEKVEEIKLRSANLEKINSFPLEKQFLIINLAIWVVHVRHVSGSRFPYDVLNSAANYFEKQYDISRMDLTNLSNRCVSDWDKDLEEMGVRPVTLRR